MILLFSIAIIGEQQHIKTLHSAGGGTLILEYGIHSGKVLVGVLDQIEFKSVTAKVTPGIPTTRAGSNSSHLPERATLRGLQEDTQDERWAFSPRNTGGAGC